MFWDYAQVQAAPSGDLILAGLKWDEETSRFRAQNLLLKATRVGECRLIFLSDAETPNPKEYLFARYERSDEHNFRIYGAIPERFAAAVEAGKLEGTVERKERSIGVKLTGVPQSIQAHFDTVGIDEFFQMDSFTTLKIVKPQK
ncbi:MAG: hypothetical protein O2955_16830 [Planctomycetota bacterium]|nr:hypothetical protein [Planctomycetota bacterium]MDA1214180.1 hypothetical protein [Planctomycetota bacterium]